MSKEQLETNLAALELLQNETNDKLTDYKAQIEQLKLTLPGSQARIDLTSAMNSTIEGIRKYGGIDVPTDDPNVPFRFLPCLTAGMAYYIAMKKAPQMMPNLKQVYEEEFKRAMDEDRDRASFSAVPGRSYFNNY